MQYFLRDQKILLQYATLLLLPHLVQVPYPVIVNLLSHIRAKLLSQIIHKSQ